MSDAAVAESRDLVVGCQALVTSVVAIKAARGQHIDVFSLALHDFGRVVVAQIGFPLGMEQEWKEQDEKKQAILAHGSDFEGH